MGNDAQAREPGTLRKRQEWQSGRVFELVSPNVLLMAKCRTKMHAWPESDSASIMPHALARYTHRVAIANGRLLSLRDGQVRFRWRDSRDKNRIKIMSLDAVEFIRRFLLRVLPAGFVKIRHFGLLANRNRRLALALCRQHLKALASDHSDVLTDQQRAALNRRCPCCKRGTLHVVMWLSTAQLLINAHALAPEDSS